MKCYKVVFEQGVTDHFELIMYTLLSAFKRTVKGMSGAISKRNVHYEVLVAIEQGVKDHFDYVLYFLLSSQQ